MALLNLVYRDQLFPRAAYRHTFEVLLERSSAQQACKTLVELLSLAHERACEAQLASRLQADLAQGRLPDLTQLREVFSPDPAELPNVVVQLRPLSDYDPLLEASGERS